MRRHRITLEIGEGDYKFLVATAKMSGITPLDMLAAAIKATPLLLAARFGWRGDGPRRWPPAGC
jgi:hypothetical protein